MRFGNVDFGFRNGGARMPHLSELRNPHSQIANLLLKTPNLHHKDLILNELSISTILKYLPLSDCVMHENLVGGTKVSTKLVSI
jgi:hypothetical protein